MAFFPWFAGLYMKAVLKFVSMNAVLNGMLFHEVLVMAVTYK
jgi:hypothetical protein